MRIFSCGPPDQRRKGKGEAVALQQSGRASKRCQACQALPLITPVRLEYPPLNWTMLGSRRFKPYLHRWNSGVVDGSVLEGLDEAGPGLIRAGPVHTGRIKVWNWGGCGLACPLARAAGRIWTSSQLLLHPVAPPALGSAGIWRATPAAIPNSNPCEQGLKPWQSSVVEAYPHFAHVIGSHSTTWWRHVIYQRRLVSCAWQIKCRKVRYPVRSYR